MNVSRADLYRIIIEEYITEEGIELSEDKADDLLAWIKGGEKPEYLDYEKEVPTPPEVPEKEDSDTFIMDAPVGADMSDEDIVASISQMIQGRDPEHVSELFQAVFAQIPGVEMGDAEEERPPTLYAPGAEGRPVAGFEIKELMDLIREVLEEGHYHDMGGEDEMYDALDPEGLHTMSDADLLDLADRAGIEVYRYESSPGEFIDDEARNEILAYLKDV